MASRAFRLNAVGLILLGIAILLHIVCTATPHMAGMEITILVKKNIKANFGLWKKCSKVLGSTICLKWENISGALKAAQAFSVLAVLVAVAGIIFSAISLFLLLKGSWKKLLPTIACIAALIAGGMVIFEDIIFAAKHEDFLQIQAMPSWGTMENNENYLSWGLGLDIIAAILLIVTGLIHGLSARSGQSDAPV